MIGEMTISGIVERFSSELRSRLGERISGIYLFGSAAKGIDAEGSDIDVLIVYSGIDERGLLEVASDISFKLACEYGRVIETIPMSKEEFDNSLGTSPFLWEVLTFGKVIFTTNPTTEWELDFKDYLILAEEYLNYAKDALKESKIRLAIDCGYNACELLVKAMIIKTKNPLASSHGGIVGQFGRLFVLTKKVLEHLGRNLNLGLELRAKARYRPQAQLDIRDAHFIIELAQELIRIAQTELR